MVRRIIDRLFFTSGPLSRNWVGKLDNQNPVLGHDADQHHPAPSDCKHSRHEPTEQKAPKIAQGQTQGQSP